MPTTYASASNANRFMVGQDNVKKQLLDLASARLLADRTGADQVRRFAIIGPPGSGKSEWARMLTYMLHAEGRVKSPDPVVTYRYSLVNFFEGQTKANVRAVFEEARGGVLHIDSMPEMVFGAEDIRGMEALVAILRELEAQPDLHVIIDGWPSTMRTFLDREPRLRAMFPTRIPLLGITVDEATECFNLLGVSEEGKSELDEVIQAMYQRTTENGTRLIDTAAHFRAVRNVYNSTVNEKIATAYDAGKIDIPITVTLGEIAEQFRYQYLV